MTALGLALDWLVEPVDGDEGGAVADGAAVPAIVRPVIAVAGLRPRCGTTTVARAIAAELAAHDPTGAGLVTASATSGALGALSLPAAGRLTRAVAATAVGHARACGRLSLVHCTDPSALARAARDLAPLVLDAEDSSAAPWNVALADAAVLVGDGRVEPALAEVVAGSLARVGPRPLLAVKEGMGTERWGCADVVIPHSRVGARLAAVGREPRGQLGRAVADLIERLGVLD